MFFTSLYSHFCTLCTIIIGSFSSPCFLYLDFYFFKLKKIKLYFRSFSPFLLISAFFTLKRFRFNHGFFQKSIIIFRYYHQYHNRTTDLPFFLCTHCQKKDVPKAHPKNSPIYSNSVIWPDWYLPQIRQHCRESANPYSHTCSYIL